MGLKGAAREGVYSHLTAFFQGFDQLVSTLLIVQTRHDGEVDLPTQGAFLGTCLIRDHKLGGSTSI